MQLYYTKTQHPRKSVTTDDKLSFNKYINIICKTANKKVNALSRIKPYRKQNQKEIFLSSFIISHFSYCPLNWMFSSKLSAKNKDAVHKRFLQIILNDYESPWYLLFEEARKATFHQWCIILLRSKFKTTWMDICLT